MARSSAALPVCSLCGWTVDISTAGGCATCGPSTTVECSNKACEAYGKDMEDRWGRPGQVVRVLPIKGAT